MPFELYGVELTDQEMVNEIVAIAGVLVESVKVRRVVEKRWQMHGIQSVNLSDTMYEVSVQIVTRKPRTMSTMKLQGTNFRALVCQFEERLKEQQERHII